MSISKRLTCKLAVAAVAVAGVVGMAGADDISKGPVEMGVSFLVETNDTARIEVAVAKSPTREDLVKDSLGGANAAGNNPGSLGILKVTTNNDAWDVEMKTLYGGKLVYVGESTPDPDNPVCPSGSTPITTGWDKGKCDAGAGAVVDMVPGVILGSTQTLVYKDNSLSTGGKGYQDGVMEDADNDTVLLVVKIGMCDLGADLHTSATANLFYAWGEPDSGSRYLPVLIDSTSLRESRQREADGTAGPGTAVSFSKVIGGSGWTGTLAHGQVSLADIGANKFRKPVTPLGGKHVQHIYVNVGLNPAGPVGFLEKKANSGTYEERFIFELTATF